MNNKHLVFLFLVIATSCGGSKQKKYEGTEYVNKSVDCEKSLETICGENIIRDSSIFQLKRLAKFSDITKGFVFISEKDTVTTTVNEDGMGKNMKFKNKYFPNNTTEVKHDCEVANLPYDTSAFQEVRYERPETFTFNYGTSFYELGKNIPLRNDSRAAQGKLEDCNFVEDRQFDHIPNLLTILNESHMVNIDKQIYYVVEDKYLGKIFATVSFQDSMSYFRFLHLNFFFQTNDRNKISFINIQLDYIGIKYDAPASVISKVLPSLAPKTKVANLAHAWLYGERIKSQGLSRKYLDGHWIPGTIKIVTSNNESINVADKALAYAESFDIKDGQIVSQTTPDTNLELKHYRYNEYRGPRNFKLNASNMLNIEKIQAFELKNKGHLYDHRYSNRMTVNLKFDTETIKTMKLVAPEKLDKWGQSAIIQIEYIKSL